MSKFSDQIRDALVTDSMLEITERAVLAGVSFINHHGRALPSVYMRGKDGKDSFFSFESLADLFFGAFTGEMIAEITDTMASFYGVTSYCAVIGTMGILESDGRIRLAEIGKDEHRLEQTIPVIMSFSRENDLAISMVFPIVSITWDSVSLSEPDIYPVEVSKIDHKIHIFNDLIRKEIHSEDFRKKAEDIIKAMGGMDLVTVLDDKHWDAMLKKIITVPYGMEDCAGSC